MSLIKCPECGIDTVSSSAKSCPRCGFPIKTFFDEGQDKVEDHKLKEDSIRDLIDLKIFDLVPGVPITEKDIAIKDIDTNEFCKVETYHQTNDDIGMKLTLIQTKYLRSIKNDLVFIRVLIIIGLIYSLSLYLA